MGISVKKAAPPATVQATVTKEYKDGSLEETKEDVQVKPVIGQNPVLVGVSIGITRNLGNFESLKASVSLTIPCAQDADEIEETYSQAKNWVDSKINEINEEISNNLN